MLCVSINWLRRYRACSPALRLLGTILPKVKPDEPIPVLYGMCGQSLSSIFWALATLQYEENEEVDEVCHIIKRETLRRLLPFAKQYFPGNLNFERAQALLELPRHEFLKMETRHKYTELFISYRCQYHVTVDRRHELRLSQVTLNNLTWAFSHFASSRADACGELVQNALGVLDHNNVYMCVEDLHEIIHNAMIEAQKKF